MWQDTTYYWRVDTLTDDGEVKIRGDWWSFTTGKATLPEVASNPRPRDGATDAMIFSRSTDGTIWGRVHLSWDLPHGVHRHVVYVGTSPDVVSDNLRGSPFHNQAPAWHLYESSHSRKYRYVEGADLSRGTTYYWRVDVVNEAGRTQGNVWSFTTGFP